MVKSIIGAWRAISLTKQSAIGTAAAVNAINTLLYFEGEPIEPEPETFYTNEGDITGEVLPTKHRLLTKKLTGKHKSKAFPHVVGLFASMAMGKDTCAVVGTTTAYKHKLEIDKTVVELPTRTLIENDGTLQYLYKGIACTEFVLSGQRGQFCEFEATLLGSAAEQTDATAKPSALDESYLAYGDVNFYTGGTFDGSAVTGGTSISARLKTWKLTYKNNGKGGYLCGDSTGQVGSIRRGQAYSVELEADIELEDASDRAALLAGTEFVARIPIVGGVANGTANYTIEVILPRVCYREAKKGVDDGILKLSAKYAVMVDPTYGGIIINIINLQATSYLVTAA
jgi:hypothetical protein